MMLFFFEKIKIHRLKGINLSLFVPGGSFMKYACVQSAIQQVLLTNFLVIDL